MEVWAKSGNPQANHRGIFHRLLFRTAPALLAPAAGSEFAQSLAPNEVDEPLRAVSAIMNHVFNSAGQIFLSFQRSIFMLERPPIFET